MRKRNNHTLVKEFWIGDLSRNISWRLREGTRKKCSSRKKGGSHCLVINPKTTGHGAFRICQAENRNRVVGRKEKRARVAWDDDAHSKSLRTHQKTRNERKEPPLDFRDLADANFFTRPFKPLVRCFTRGRQKSLRGFHKNRLTSSPDDSCAPAVTSPRNYHTGDVSKARGHESIRHPTLKVLYSPFPGGKRSRCKLIIV